MFGGPDASRLSRAKASASLSLRSIVAINHLTGVIRPSFWHLRGLSTQWGPGSHARLPGRVHASVERFRPVPTRSNESGVVRKYPFDAGHEVTEGL